MSSKLLTALLLSGLIGCEAAAWGSWHTPVTEVISRAEKVEWAAPIPTDFNLFQMQPSLYRSALPKTDDQVVLQQLGIKTVINFYQKSDDAWLQDPSVKQVHLPLHTQNIDDEDVLTVMRTIQQGEKDGAVLLHCKHGQHRTGVMAAMHRILIEGWSREQAMGEMLSAGFGGEERMDDALSYVRTADIGALKAALESGRCSTSPLSLCNVSAWLSDTI